MKILHIADIHIGDGEQYGEKLPGGKSARAADLEARLEDVVQIVIDNNVKYVLFAGDAFKTRQPNPTRLRTFAFWVRKLAEFSTVCLLVGNHDLAASRKASSIDVFDSVGMDNVHVFRGPGLHDFKDFQLIALPYPVDVDTEGMGDLNWALSKTLKTRLDTCLDRAHGFSPIIVMGHFSIVGADYGSERAVMLGKDVTMNESDFDHPSIDYVAMGHLHRHQVIGNKIVYPGSLLRLNFGEKNDLKGVVLVSLDNGDVKHEFIEVPDRPFVEAEMDLTSETDPTGKMMQVLKREWLVDAVFRFKIKIGREDLHRLDEAAIIEQANKMCWYFAGISKTVIGQHRTRLEKRASELSDREIVKVFFEDDEQAIEAAMEYMQ